MRTNKWEGDSVVPWKELEIRAALDELHRKRRRNEIGIDAYLIEYKHLTQCYEEHQRIRAETRKLQGRVG